MKGCTTKREITGTLTEKNGWHYILLYLYVNGRRKPKMINTGLPVKGYHKREALQKKDTAIRMLNEGATLEMVLDKVEGKAFHKAPKQPELKVAISKPKVDFIKKEIFDELEDCGEEFPPRYNEIVHREPGACLRGSRGQNGNMLQVADYFESWIANYHTQIQDSSYESYSEQIHNRVIPYFSQFNLTLTELTSYDCTLFYRYCFLAGRLDGKPGDVSSSTVNRVHSYFSKGLSDASRARLIGSNPARDAEIPKNNVFILDPYTEDELAAIVNSAIGDPCEFAIVMACLFGLRRGEACGLRERSFDLSANQVRINHTVGYLNSKIRAKDRVKSDKSNRLLPFEDVQGDYIRLRILRNQVLRNENGPRWNPRGYLSVWDNGDLIGPNTVTDHLVRIAGALGLPQKRLHDIRHSVISILMKHNVNMRLIQALAGHADIQTTETYSHFNTNDLMVGAKVISNAIPLAQALEGFNLRSVANL